MIVSIVGRPNVGKSSLFNLLIEKNKSIISQRSGTTRDTISDYVTIKDKSIMLIDTGGLNDEDFILSKKINIQTKEAMESSDIIILVFDAKEPLTDFDISLFKLIVKLKKRYIVVVNKIDEKNENFFYEFNRFSDAVFVSTKKQQNINLLKEKLYEMIQKSTFKKDAQTKLAIVGRANVGKSKLFNAIIRKERSIVSDIAGTTIDSVDTFLNYEERLYQLVDTAGLRLRLKKDSLDKLASYFATFSIERCDIAIFVIDAYEGVKTQDLKIASMLVQKNKGIVVILNKWDLIKQDSDKVFKALRNKLQFINFASFLRVSANDGKNIGRIMKNVKIVEDYYNLKVTTKQLNEAFKMLSKENHSVQVHSKTIKLKYIAQVDTKPPTFVIFTNTEKIPASYERYIKNQIYSMFKFTGCPINLVFKKD